MYDSTQYFSADLRTYPTINVPNFIDIVAHPQIPMLLEQLSGPDDIFVDGNSADFILWGGRLDYNVRYDITQKYPLNSLPFTFTVDTSDTAKITIEPDLFGTTALIFYDADNRREITDLFVVNPLVRDLDGNEITELTLAVGESRTITYYAGLPRVLPFLDIAWHDTNLSSEKISFVGSVFGTITLNDASVVTTDFGVGPVVTITGILEGTTTLRVDGLYAANILEIPVTVTA